MKRPKEAVKNLLWTKALKSSADPERSRHLLDSLAAAGAKAQLEKLSADSMRVFAALSGGSQALANCCWPIPIGCRCSTSSGLNSPAVHRVSSRNWDGYSNRR